MAVCRCFACPEVLPLLQGPEPLFPLEGHQPHSWSWAAPPTSGWGAQPPRLAGAIQAPGHSACTEDQPGSQSQPVRLNSTTRWNPWAPDPLPVLSCRLGHFHTPVFYNLSPESCLPPLSVSATANLEPDRERGGRSGRQLTGQRRRPQSPR